MLRCRMHSDIHMYMHMYMYLSHFLRGHLQNCLQLWEGDALRRGHVVFELDLDGGRVLCIGVQHHRVWEGEGGR